MDKDASVSLRVNRWSILVAVTSAAVLWLSLWVFNEMVDDTPKGEFVRWDEPAIQLVRGGPDSLRAARPVVVVARGITLLGSEIVLTSVVVIGIAGLAWIRRWRAAIILLAAGLGALLVTIVLKDHFMRVRPDVVQPLVAESSWSFPSGHSLCSAAIYITLGAIWAGRLSARRAQVALMAGAFLLSFLIGLSRIYLGVHYPTDVLAGWSAGTAWAIICAAALIGWEHHAATRTTPARRA